MLVTLLPMMTLVKALHDSNAHSAMEVTLPGMVTLVRRAQLANAPSRMEVTAPLTPGIDEGIVTVHGGAGVSGDGDVSPADAVAEPIVALADTAARKAKKENEQQPVPLREEVAMSMSADSHKKS
jgi:hypothetical protein